MTIYVKTLPKEFNDEYDYKRHVSNYMGGHMYYTLLIGSRTDNKQVDSHFKANAKNYFKYS